MVAPNATPADVPSPSAAAPSPSPSPTSAGGMPPVSAAKVAANQANAQRSTGPRTDAGKAASRMNAVKHGLRAELCVLPGEDAREFAEFVDAAVRELRPSGALQAGYAREVAVHTWRLRRVSAVERLLFARHDPEPEDYAHADEEDIADYGRLMTTDPAELSLDDCARLEKITKRLLRAGRRALVRADNAAGAGYPGDDPAHTAEVLAAMLRSRSTSDHAPDSVLWTCQRYEAQILRARSTALRELLNLQRAHGAAPAGDDVWPGEQVRVGYPPVPEDRLPNRDQKRGRKRDPEDDRVERAAGGPGAPPAGPAEEDRPAAPNEPAASNEPTSTAPARPAETGATTPRAERTQPAAAPAPPGPAPTPWEDPGRAARRRAGY